MSEQREDLRAWLLQTQKLLLDAAQNIDEVTIERLREARERAFGSVMQKTAPKEVPFAAEKIKPAVARNVVEPAVQVVSASVPVESASPVEPEKPPKQAKRSKSVKQSAVAQQSEPVLQPTSERQFQPEQQSKPHSRQAPVQDADDVAASSAPNPPRVRIAIIAQRVPVAWVATAALVAVVAWFGLVGPARDVTQALEDVPLLSSEEDLAFYENVEFVRWLAATEEGGQ